MNRLGISRLSHLWNDKSWAHIVPQATGAACEGHPLSFDYLPHPICSVEMLDQRIAEVEPVIMEASRRYPGCQWSMKPAIWGLPTGIELFEQALTRLNLICRANNISLRMDTPQAPFQKECLELALGLPCVQPVLAVSEPGFDEHLRLCIDSRRNIRLVKGYSEAYVSEYTVSDRMVDAVQTLWQAGMPAAIATHDPEVLQVTMDLPSYQPEMFEVEMVAHLVPSHQLKVISAHMLRLYYPYGANAGRFFVKRVLGSPVNRHAALRATHNR
ncbi:MAG: hypothetical protein ACYC1M_18660 [Armatimonadota bacterium]